MKYKETDKIIDAISDQPKFIMITKNEPSWIEKFLARIGFKSLIYKTFEITPLTLFNKFRISSLCLKFDLPEMVDLELSGDKFKIVFNDQNINKMKVMLKNIQDNMKYFAMIIAITLENKKKAPDEKLIRFIYENTTTDDIIKILPLIISGIDLGFFLSIMISINKENFLTVPETPEKK